jgi:NitT/TauT family transport system substrate-binding protein
MPFGGRSVAGLAHYLALEDGFYVRHGVDVSSPAINANVFPAVLSGEAPLAAGALEGVLSAAAGGAPVVIVGSQLTGMAFSIVAQPWLRKPEDLRGKRMGVASFTSPSHTAALLYLRSTGLQPSSDVALTRLGGVPEMHAALLSGALESAAMPPPLSYALVREGYTELADLSTLELKYHQAVLFTTRAWLQENTDVARRILAGYAEAQRMVLTDPVAAHRVLAKWVGVEETEVLDQTYALALRGFAPGPTLDLEAVQSLIDLLAESQPNLGALRSATVVDNTLANEAARRYGFPTR